MISKKLKKLICLMAAVTCLLGTSVISYADTTNFTLTVTKSGANEDNMSKRTNKSGTNYEGRFYATPTSFVGTTGTMYVKSVKLYAPVVESAETNFASAVHLNVRRDAAYKNYAPSGQFYYLKARFGASSGSTLKATGRYTP